MNKKIIFIIILLFLFSFSAGVYYRFSLKQISMQFPENSKPLNGEITEQREARSACLVEGESATAYPHYWNFGSRFEFGTINVYVFKREEIVFSGVSEEETERQIKEKKRFNFPIDYVEGNGHPLEIKRCGVYVIRKFEPDEKKIFHKKNELWHYNYQGEGKMLMSNEEFRFYSFGFHINETEAYGAFIRSWYGEPENHALVIKDLKTLEDKYVVTLRELMERFSDVEPATISLDYWGENRFGTEDILGFYLLNSERTGFSINIKTKELKIFRY